MIYGPSSPRIDNYKTIYSGETSNVIPYILKSSSSTRGWCEPYNPYSAFTGDSVDEVTNQIVNNKRINLKFSLHYSWYTKEGQEEIKYLDDIVMNYVTQMIPSSAILQVEYLTKKNNTRTLTRGSDENEEQDLNNDEEIIQNDVQNQGI